MITEALAEILGAKEVHSGDMLGRFINGEWVYKKSVQTKDLRIVWFEEAKEDEIDTRYYNTDGTKK